MKIVDGQLIFEMGKCYSCAWDSDKPGYRYAMKKCVTCNGSGNGKRGGKRGCKGCFGGYGKSIDFENYIPCYQCKGTGQAMENEHSLVPKDLVRQIPIVARKIDITVSDICLNIPPFFSITDYGKSYNAANNDNIIEEFYQTSHQACNFVRNGQLCKHIRMNIYENGVLFVGEW